LLRFTTIADQGALSLWLPTCCCATEARFCGSASRTRVPLPSRDSSRLIRSSAGLYRSAVSQRHVIARRQVVVRRCARFVLKENSRRRTAFPARYASPAAANLGSRDAHGPPATTSRGVHGSRAGGPGD
jgi:hypothetical protein